MLVCGIELTANEAIICLLSHDSGVFNVPDCRQRSFTLPKSADTEAVRQFHFSFSKLMDDYRVDEIVIIERAQKGKLAGSAISFKLEAAIQLQSLPVTLINHTEMKAQLKRNKIQADLPPSSKVKRLHCWPQIPPTLLPAAVPPVKETLSTPGCDTRY